MKVAGDKRALLRSPIAEDRKKGKQNENEDKEVHDEW